MGIPKHSVTEAKPHGEKYPIQKSDCIGHIQKRKGTGLQNKKKQYGKTKLSDGRTICGAGRLTEKLCDKLQQYYGHARRDNLGDLDSMVKAAKAILHHSWSTDDEPDHSYCPVGATSWCKFQRANALGETPPAHHTTIPKAVGEVIKPVFDRLCDPALLCRCLRGGTQNPNESLHATIWECCPKEQYAGNLVSLFWRWVERMDDLIECDQSVILQNHHDFHKWRQWRGNGDLQLSGHNQT